MVVVVGQADGSDRAVPSAGAWRASGGRSAGAVGIVFVIRNGLGWRDAPSLHGVALHERANGAIVMTTSFFTEPAKQFARHLKGQLSLKDFVDLQTWLREVSLPK